MDYNEDHTEYKLLFVLKTLIRGGACRSRRNTDTEGGSVLRRSPGPLTGLTCSEPPNICLQRLEHQPVPHDPAVDQQSRWFGVI